MADCWEGPVNMCQEVWALLVEGFMLAVNPNSTKYPITNYPMTQVHVTLRVHVQPSLTNWVFGSGSMLIIGVALRNTVSENEKFSNVHKNSLNGSFFLGNLCTVCTVIPIRDRSNSPCLELTALLPPKHSIAGMMLSAWKVSLFKLFSCDRCDMQNI